MSNLEGKPQIYPEHLKERKGLKLISTKEAEFIEYIFLDHIRAWQRKVKPGVIILTATSATPFGYLIKRAWRVAFPEEKQPIFMNIDPKHLSGMDELRKWDEEEEKALPAKKKELRKMIKFLSLTKWVVVEETIFLIPL